MEHCSNFWTFEIASLPNVHGHYLRKYGTLRNTFSDLSQIVITFALKTNLTYLTTISQQFLPNITFFSSI